MVWSEFAKEDMINAQSTLKFCLKYSWMSPESKITLGLWCHQQPLNCAVPAGNYKDKNFILGLTWQGEHILSLYSYAD